MSSILLKISNFTPEGNVWENLDVLSVLRNCTHLHVSRFMQKVNASALTVDRTPSNYLEMFQ